MLPLVVLGGAWPGMMTVETIGRIRRAFLVEHKPIRQIVRDLRISRQTVRIALERFEEQIFGSSLILWNRAAPSSEYNVYQC